MKLNQLTILEALDGLKKKKFSSLELTQACLAQIKKTDKKLNAFITVCEKGALNQAREADRLRKKGEKSPLLGIPLGIKDIFVTQGIKTTAASQVLADYLPQYDATVVKRLKAAGAVILGKCNLDAWAHGASGENSDFGPTKNPWNLNYAPGGSSSGSGAAVAADQCFAATGTDTGGSIRLPASFCNLAGLKPTYGRVSRYGVIAMASSLDSPGLIAKTVADQALVLEIIAGPDSLDATTPPVPVPHYPSFLEKGIKNLKIGLPQEYFDQKVDVQVKKALEKALHEFKKLGAKIIKVSLPHTQYAIPTYYLIVSSEISSNLARYDGIRYGFDRSRFGDEAKRRIMLGTYALSAGYYDAYYLKAQKARTLIKEDFEKAFRKVDVLVAPTSPTPPFKLGEKTTDPLLMYLADLLTCPINLAGVPALALPCGFSQNNLPLGFQIIAPHFKEELLLQAGHAYQKVTAWHQQKPNLT